jgi:Flp pilus assembly protein TadG
VSAFVRRGRRRDRSRGQSLVEFALVLVPFLVILMGIVDLGRGIYTYNGVAEAARELARATAVHQCVGSLCTIGTSTETANVRSTQNSMVPGLGGASAVVTYACTDMTDAAVPKSKVTNAPCPSGDFVKVTVSVPFQVLTPVLSMVAPSTLSSTTHVEIP